MGADWIKGRTWAGGRVRRVDGREVFVIERRIGNGDRRVITLKVDTEKQAKDARNFTTRPTLPIGPKTSGGKDLRRVKLTDLRAALRGHKGVAEPTSGSWRCAR